MNLKNMAVTFGLAAASACHIHTPPKTALQPRITATNIAESVADGAEYMNQRGIFGPGASICYPMQGPESTQWTKFFGCLTQKGRVTFVLKLR